MKDSTSIRSSIIAVLISALGIFAAGCSTTQRISTEKGTLDTTRIVPDIVITTTGDSCKVDPAHFYARGRTYVFIQARGSKVTILFPEPELTGDRLIDLNDGEIKVLKIRPQDNVNFKRDADGKIHYKYAIFSHGVRLFGKGSEPEMIVP